MQNGTMKKHFGWECLPQRRKGAEVRKISKWDYLYLTLLNKLWKFEDLGSKIRPRLTAEIRAPRL
jgi:hypothetical protein